MAPKKSTGRHPRTTIETSSMERRTKHREDVSTWSEQVVEKQVPSPSSIRQVMTMAMCPITSGQRIIFSFLNDLGLQVGDQIEVQVQK